MSAQPVEVDAPRVTIHVGDCRDVLRTLPADSVDCVTTSPPYFGLRDYSTGAWEGGDPACEHRVRTPGAVAKSQASSTLTSTSRETIGHTKEGYRDICARCGARRIDRQIGLEASVEAYVAELVTVFREVRRVLKPTGCVFLNLGDSYAGSGRGPTGKNGVGKHEQRQGFHTPGVKASAFKNKDLMLIPFRVAIALQDDGWWLRSDIIWAKRAPMPESVTDRPTSAHEHIFLLTKRERYYYDAEAVREEQVSGHPSGNGFKREARLTYADDNGPRGSDEQWLPSATGRNLRNVWHLGPEPFPEAHFATYPTEVPRRAISAGSSERGVCSKCGKPWVRVTTKTDHGFADRTFRSPHNVETPWMTNGTGATTLAKVIERTTTGWQPSCHCDGRLVRHVEEVTVTRDGTMQQQRVWFEYIPNGGVMPTPQPAVVLDPFAGSGTTLMVANRLGRHAIGIDLSPKYAEMARRRVIADAGMFANVEVIDHAR